MNEIKNGMCLNGVVEEDWVGMNERVSNRFGNILRLESLAKKAYLQVILSHIFVLNFEVW